VVVITKLKSRTSHIAALNVVFVGFILSVPSEYCFIFKEGNVPALVCNVAPFIPIFIPVGV
jgi:hypothetical protein